MEENIEEKMEETILRIVSDVDGCLYIIIGDENSDIDLVGMYPSQKLIDIVEEILKGDSEYPNLQATIESARDRFERARDDLKNIMMWEEEEEEEEEREERKKWGKMNYKNLDEDGGNCGK